MQNLLSLLNNISNKKLLVIFPHPDDESVMSAGLLQYAVSAGWEVRVVTLTHGEAGKIHINGNGKSLKEIRRHELEKALGILGVSNFSIHHFPDAKLRNTKQPWQQLVRQEIADFDPGVIITYDPTGISGHPDHIALSAEISKLLSEVKNKPSKTKQLLLWPSFKGYIRTRMYHPQVLERAAEPTHVFSLSPQQVLQKYRAIVVHKSQQIGSSQPLPLWLVMIIFGRREYYTVATDSVSKPVYVEFSI